LSVLTYVKHFGHKTENLHLTLLSINRLNQTEPVAFSDLPLVEQTFKGPLKTIWKQSDPSEALITTKLCENCRVGLIESVHEG
jgi:hypothetical protein